MGPRDRTIIAGVSVTAVVLLALFLNGTVSLIVRLPTVTNQVATTATSLTNPTTTGQVNPIVKITIGAGQRASKWVSGLDGLPQYETGVSWEVCNEGTAKADNTEIVVKSDGVVITKVTGALDSSNCSSAYADLEYSYDTTHQVTVEASSGESRDSKLLVISAILPRALLYLQPAPTSDIVEAAKVFVTPKDPVVLDALWKVFLAWSPYYTDHNGMIDNSYIGRCPDGVLIWTGRKCESKVCACDDHVVVLRAIQKWVWDHITNEMAWRTNPLIMEEWQLGCSDNQDYSGYVQLPRETLKSGKGGQTDMVLLTVSLARAAGIGSDEVFAVLGRNAAKAIGIGWVKLVVDPKMSKYTYFGTDWRFPPWAQCKAGQPVVPASTCSVKKSALDLASCAQAVYYFNDETAVTGDFGPVSLASYGPSLQHSGMPETSRITEYSISLSYLVG